ncbi:undecaprenyl/decaprenyl-phosphate alpha-N-acetylglucosaminyl 1-phosphate transferase [Candidatus Babeliales bacterium]|nr:undecaprenyl/decaprenyl-phosphate alpha-N-acetylglucosaminyl 1-phosphate transferase [Candidatus Babeliales bacterium]
MRAIFIRHIFFIIFPLILSFYVFPILIKTAFRFNILDVPDGKIKNHKRAIPYLGGAGLYIPFIATLSIAYPFENKILWFFLGVTFLFFLGLVDDLKILHPAQKLFGQMLAVLCFLKGGFSLKNNFLSDFLNIGMSSFWMLLVINAFNLVDIMDGLSSLLAIISSFSFLIIALLLKQYDISILILAFLSPLLVFFYYNKPPAKIYLGDSGSLFIGGFLAALPLLFPWSSQSFDAYYTAVIILGIPLLEVFSLIVIRSWLKIPFYKGSPHHFAIFLKHKGWSVLKILIFILIMSFFLSIIAIFFLFGFINFYTLFFLGIIFLVIWCYFIFSKI